MSKSIGENSQNLSDELVIKHIKDGDERFLNVIIERYSPLIVSIAGAYIPELYIEDAVQEAKIALTISIYAFDSKKASFNTFATLCIKRAISDFKRENEAKKRRPEGGIAYISDVFEGDEVVNGVDNITPETILIEKDEYNNLTESVKLELSKLEFDILQLLVFDMSRADIAARLGINEKQVDNAISRIRRKFKK